MKIALITDTHDNTPAIVWIIEYLNEKGITIALHAGDMINPGILHRFGKHYEGHLHFIFGNNDGEKTIAQQRSDFYDNMTCHHSEMRECFEDKKIFMQHYSTIAETAAKSGEFDLSIGGHDHIYRIIPYGDCVFVNPGNTVTKDKWLPQKPDCESSFVVFDLETMTGERVLLPDEFQYE